MSDILEKMDDFFTSRLDGYDEHMLNYVKGCREGYVVAANSLPRGITNLLDLGCGTGLELAPIFERTPDLAVTGVDLSAGMLAALEDKFRDKALTLIRGSYFDVPLGNAEFDAAVSVESLHHFTAEEKTGLYRRLCCALKPGGYFVLTDYFAHEDAFEEFCRAELKRLKAEQGIADEDFYHYDTPLTLAHEMQALREAGFSRVEDLRFWGATHTLKAIK